MYYIQAVTSGDADHGAYPKLIWNLKPPFAQVYIIYPPHRLLSYGPSPLGHLVISAHKSAGTLQADPKLTSLLSAVRTPSHKSCIMTPRLTRLAVRSIVHQRCKLLAMNARRSYSPPPSRANLKAWWKGFIAAQKAKHQMTTRADPYAPSQWPF